MSSTEHLDKEDSNSSVSASVRLSDLFDAEQLRTYLERSDWRAGWMVAVNVALIGIALALPVLWLNPITVLLSLLLLGGRQLGLAVIYHDCAHSVFFRTRWLNDFVGHWVAGALLNTSLYAYRAYHLKHHRFAGTPDDPDLALANHYPTSRERLRRKLLRDLTGRTGVKSMTEQFKKMTLGRNAPFLISHLLLLTLLAVLGAAWAYLLWWVAYILVYQFVLRVRFIAEHGIAIDRLSADVRENTCTTLLSWWERLFIGPNYVNYHLEHHMNAAVPCYRLAKLHDALQQRGFFAQHDCLSVGYAEVLRKAVRSPLTMDGGLAQS